MPVRAYTGSKASYGEAHIPGLGLGFNNGGINGNGMDRGNANRSRSSGPGISPGEYGGPPFPSPPDTINEPEQPTRASTWASNLRSTLFAAISTSHNPNTTTATDSEDRYTRQILPTHLNRNSTIRSTRSITEGQGQGGYGRTSNYPLVIDEKDEQEMDAADGAIGSRFMMSRDSGSGSSGASVGTRMSIADRYKSWSRGGGGAGPGIAGGDDGWPKPVLAGGGRARGATGQYV